jgi:hypothetical protein
MTTQLCHPQPLSIFNLQLLFSGSKATAIIVTVPIWQEREINVVHSEQLVLRLGVN